MLCKQLAEQPASEKVVENLQYPDLDGRAGGCAEPVSVRAEAESVDGVATIQGVQMLPFIQIPQHGLPILCDENTNHQSKYIKTIWITKYHHSANRIAAQSTFKHLPNMQNRTTNQNQCRSITFAQRKAVKWWCYLSTRSAEGPIRGDSDRVQESSVTNVVGLQLAVSQIPHLCTIR